MSWSAGHSPVDVRRLGPGRLFSLACKDALPATSEREDVLRLDEKPRDPHAGKIRRRMRTKRYPRREWGRSGDSTGPDAAILLSPRL